jgi:CarD family transcriptional regulator
MSGMKVMIPVDSARKVGLRMIISKDNVSRVIDILQGKETESISDWKLRYVTNLEKMKSGSIYKVAEVARSLSLRSREKGLSSGERKLLDSACQLIAEELSYVQNKPISVINTMVGEMLERPADVLG